jgi:hypothetical protein
MTQEKTKRIITACVSAATVLLILLSSFLIYQWITIAVKDKRIKEKEKEIARLEQIIEKGEESVEFYESLYGKEWLAIHNGWVRPEE